MRCSVVVVVVIAVVVVIVVVAVVVVVAVQPKDKVVPFFKKCVYLVGLKLSLQVVPFCETQANSVV